MSNIWNCQLVQHDTEQNRENTEDKLISLRMLVPYATQNKDEKETS